MNFDWGDQRKAEIYRRAIYPESIKKETNEWNTIKGYIYIISKRFAAHPNDPERELMKIGFSDFNTDDKREKTKERKDLSRLQGFKTTLVSFKWWRCYLFDERQNERDRGAAYQTEQELHKLIVDRYNPPSVRITFNNVPMTGDFKKDRPSEWFWVKGGIKGIEKILKFIDEEIYTNTQFEPIFSTRFLGEPTDENANYEHIYPDKEYPNRPPKITSMVVTKGTVKERNEISRTSEAFEAKRITQRQRLVDNKEVEKLKKEKVQIQREDDKKIERDTKFWYRVFKASETKGRFFDKNMGERDGRKDDGKFPQKIVTKVEKPKRMSNSPPNMFVVHYKPDVTRKVLREMTNEDIEFHTDYLPLHEAMDLKSFKDLKKKYIAEYNHFKKKYRYGFIELEDN